KKRNGTLAERGGPGVVEQDSGIAVELERTKCQHSRHRGRRHGSQVFRNDFATASRLAAKTGGSMDRCFPGKKHRTMEDHMSAAPVIRMPAENKGVMLRGHP